ncbi:MAG: hypothetical protein ACYDHT_04995 [Solirubrobacteraceae bacterium]
MGSEVLAWGAGGAGASAQVDGAFLELPLRCVSSDPLDGCSCKARIPRAVVEQAWRRELATSGDHEGRFFHLIHDGGVWQAYGLGNGQVRGVYCPSHNSQRAARSRAALCDVSDVAHELVLAA